MATDEQTATLERLRKEIEKRFPTTVKRGGSLRAPSPSQRLSWGYNLLHDRVVIKLRAAIENGSAADWARQYIARRASALTKYDIEAHLEIVGDARIGVPNTGSTDFPPRAESLGNTLGPGMSLGNALGGAGSIGLVVVVEPPGEEPFIAVTGAAHVLALNKEMRESEDIASPAPGDRDPPKTSDLLESLYDGSLLIRLSDKSPQASKANRSDVYFVRVPDKFLSNGAKKVDRRNCVPDPTDPDNPGKRLQISSVVPLREIHDLVNETIYKVGRTTWFSSGRLDLATAANVTLRMHNGFYYHYENLSVVEFPKNGDFSQPGDSGGLVYTADGRALGFVVGVEDRGTLFCPAETALSNYRARLYDSTSDDF